ncbi:MAG: hypothetical protein ACYDBX_02400 [Patescibacteria group bacterium]
MTIRESRKRLLKGIDSLTKDAGKKLDAQLKAEKKGTTKAVSDRKILNYNYYVRGLLASRKSIIKTMDNLT